MWGSLGKGTGFFPTGMHMSLVPNVLYTLVNPWNAALSGLAGCTCSHFKLAVSSQRQQPCYHGAETVERQGIQAPKSWYNR